MNTLVKFEPQKALAKDVAYDAAIEYAQRVKDWPGLEAAVGDKVEQQKEFVAWWERAVAVNHGGNRKNQVPRSEHLSFNDAEELTGIKHQQVSRWRKKLANEEAYRTALYGVAY